MKDEVAAPFLRCLEVHKHVPLTAHPEGNRTAPTPFRKLHQGAALLRHGLDDLVSRVLRDGAYRGNTGSTARVSRRMVSTTRRSTGRQKGGTGSSYSASFAACHLGHRRRGRYSPAAHVLKPPPRVLTMTSTPLRSAITASSADRRRSEGAGAESSEACQTCR